MIYRRICTEVAAAGVSHDKIGWESVVTFNDRTTVYVNNEPVVVRLDTTPKAGKTYRVLVALVEVDPRTGEPA